MKYNNNYSLIHMFCFQLVKMVQLDSIFWDVIVSIEKPDPLAQAYPDL